MKIIDKNALTHKIFKLTLLTFTAFISFAIGIAFFNYVIMPKYVKLGEETICPDLINLTGEEAKSQAEKNDLEIYFGKYEYDMVVEEGKIISQNPIPGIKVKKGRKISVAISKGPEKVFVPDLSGLSFEQANRNLKSTYLDVGEVTYVYDEQYEKDVVISNIPTPNTTVSRNTLINLIVSKGIKPDFIISPSLVGKSFEEAKRILAENGLVLGNIVYELNEEVLPETVIRQSIAPGKEVLWGDTVNVIVSQ